MSDKYVMKALRVIRLTGMTNAYDALDKVDKEELLEYCIDMLKEKDGNVGETVKQIKEDKEKFRPDFDKDSGRDR